MIRRTFSSLLVAIPLAAGAQPPTDASLRTLVEVAQLRQQYETAIASVDLGMRNSIATASADHPLTPKQQNDLQVVYGRAHDELESQVSWEVMQPIVLDAYRQAFTQEEVDGLIAFYRTPTGKSVMGKMGTISQHISMETQSRLTPVMAHLRSSVDGVIKSPATH